MQVRTQARTCAHLHTRVHEHTHVQQNRTRTCMQLWIDISSRSVHLNNGLHPRTPVRSHDHVSYVRTHAHTHARTHRDNHMHTLQSHNRVRMYRDSCMPAWTTCMLGPLKPTLLQGIHASQHFCSVPTAEDVCTIFQSPHTANAHGHVCAKANTHVQTHV